MQKVISTEKKPIKLWLDDIEEGALAQAKNLANLPFIHKWIAIMPDSHQGYGMPIGGVMATDGVVIPNAVGVDIGCGMCAVKTSLTDIDRDTLKKIMGEIRKVIPVGFSKHKEEQDEGCLKMPLKQWKDVNSISDDFDADIAGDNYPIVFNHYNNALKSLGTLGGGNHFIEIQKGSDGHIWIMIHSGSRNLGFQVAKHYNEVAKKLNLKWFSEVSPEVDLAFLPIGTPEADDYLREMQYCVDYALANRKLMMERVKNIFVDVTDLCNNPDHKFIEALSFTEIGRLGCPVCGGDPDKMILFDEMINIAHNYASLEHHFGKDVWVHRKGATLAREGVIGIIPGSQGTKSYMVEGKGNPDSFNSCSHGAGRLMGRKQAIRTLDLEKEVKALEDKGILHSIRGAKQLDEAPSAYKNIETVMKNQEDLVEILVELTPLAVVKG